ncbi:MAG: isoprenyl transferase [Desulfuromonadales bacterium]|nr:isoprenyl transferase [Desulfuromonadales bacterium]
MTTRPRHIAIIMDGNGRWAESRHLPRILGHRRGVETVRKIVTAVRNEEIPYLTLYAFSSENWQRPDEEVGALMGLLGHYLSHELKTMLQEDICLQVIGDTSRLPENVRAILLDAVQKTAGNRTMTLILALSYGGRAELVQAARQLAVKVAAGELSPDAIDHADFADCLETQGIPDPDLLIRTSGEMRISNFLLWQIAYAELYFSETYWPDFDETQLQAALAEYARRQRRFGLTGAQLRREDSHS